MANENGTKTPRISSLLTIIIGAVVGLMVWWVQQMMTGSTTTQISLQALRGEIEALKTGQVTIGVVVGSVENLRGDIRELRTWRENIDRQVKEDHILLLDLWNRGAQRDQQLSNMLDLMRELKDIVSKFGAEQIAQREALWRMEQRQQSLNGQRKGR